MQFSNVYITATSKFLPNAPVDNEEMEAYLGLIDGKPSKSRRIVLRSNGIKQRYYALTKEGKPTHTNAKMTAAAVRSLFNNDPQKIKSLQLLCCGTSSPDQMMPSHAVMVHGELPETNSMEVVSPSGVCCAGMHALKYAFMSIRTGEAEMAVSSGSERISTLLRAENFEDEARKLNELEENPYISFEKEFLRWMLSDGASAFLLSNAPNENGVSLRIDWMDGFSFAHQKEACMYMAGEKEPDGSIKSYKEFSHKDQMEKSVFSIKQDVKLLSENIVPLGGIGVIAVLKKHGMQSSEIDYFLPHMSSEFFRDKIYTRLKENGTAVEYDKWFVNLPRVGNVGSASVYLMVDELFHSGKLKKGEKIFLLVPESSRFSYMYALLTVV
ncbi:MAG: beta-ketoacyl-ACP synthase III [Bacteroidetes bacterium]|nr:beta-ketoacyl-ACP synthase III [Bacteroidota bacterium]MBS1974816.1 beta-ketoacyl-ACP synthase III [Bacteroidota bacterium]